MINASRKKKKALLLITYYLLLTTFFAGCGYTTRSSISNKYKTIYITPFLNKVDITQESDIGSKYKVYRPLLETDITKAVNDKFLFDGNLKPVKKESADLILKGELVEFSRDPLRYSDNDDVEEYRLNLRVNLTMWDVRKNQLLWEENNFTGDTEYFTSYYPVAAERKDEGQAVNDAIADLARRIVERTVEEW